MTTKQYSIKGQHRGWPLLTQYRNTRQDAEYTKTLLLSSGYEDVEIFDTTDYREWLVEDFWNNDKLSAAKYARKHFELPLNVIVQIWDEVKEEMS